MLCLKPDDTTTVVNEGIATIAVLWVNEAALMKGKEENHIRTTFNIGCSGSCTSSP